jgi:hypothetical protein
MTTYLGKAVSCGGRPMSMSFGLGRKGSTGSGRFGVADLRAVRQEKVTEEVAGLRSRAGTDAADMTTSHKDSADFIAAARWFSLAPRSALGGLPDQWLAVAGHGGDASALGRGAVELRNRLADVDDDQRPVGPVRTHGTVDGPSSPGRSARFGNGSPGGARIRHVPAARCGRWARRAVMLARILNNPTRIRSKTGSGRSQRASTVAFAPRPTA